jgi:hypothetical protein
MLFSRRQAWPRSRQSTFYPLQCGTGLTCIIKNVFVEYLKSIQTTEEFEFMYHALEHLLTNPILAHNTYLPNSTKQIGCHQEMLMFFWKLVQENSVSTIE